MTRAQIIAAFNAWMRHFTEDPEAFEAEFQTVLQFLTAQQEGQEPSYGEECMAVLEHYHAKLEGGA